MHPYDHCSIIYNGQELEAAQVSISRWEDKKALVHLHNGILLGSKKQGSLTFCNSMYESGEHYAKWNKPARERQIPYDLTYLWNLINKINKIYRLIDTENRLMAVRREGFRGTGWKRWKE